MCRIDDSEGTWLGSTVQRTRKPRRCEECHRDILVGEKYERSTWVDDGINVCIACEHCSAARSWLSVHCHGWVTGALAEELQEHIEEKYVEDRIHRLAVGVRRKWQRFDGKGLMPLPALVVSKPYVEKPHPRLFGDTLM